MNQLPIGFFNKMKNIEEKLVAFLDNPEGINENHIIFEQYLQDQELSKNKYELKAFLYLIAVISNNHHQSQSFFTKIELILKCLQEKIQSYFVNFEIFNIFQKNKRLLLFLFKSGIITPNEEIYSIFKNNIKYINAKYLEYFYPEFEQYIDENMKKSIQDQILELKNKESNNEFDKNRERGENDNYICQLIQKDSIVDFITYMEKTNISPSSTIQQSIYETNSFLLNKTPTLIEYSAFYGSIQIFKYLHQKNAELTDSIWLYAIHGKNAEIIQFLEENKIETLQKTYQNLIIESIKCHHNEITDYLRNNFNDIYNEMKHKGYVYRKCFKYYNFSLLTNSDISFLIEKCNQQNDNDIPYYLCKYDYYLIIQFLLNSKSENKLDINHQYEIRNTSNEYSFVEALTIINISARKGNIDMIKLLLNIPTLDVNIKTTKSYYEPRYKSFGFPESNRVTEKKTILHEAVESGYREVVQFILKNTALDADCLFVKKKVFDDHFSTAHMHYDEKCKQILLHFAIERGYIEIVKLLLLDPKVDINKESTLIVHKSGGCIAYTSSTKIIEEFSLYFAINNGDNMLIRFLLDQPQIDINLGIKEYSADWISKELSQEKTPLSLATEKNNLEIMQKLKSNPRIKLQ